MHQLTPILRPFEAQDAKVLTRVLNDVDIVRFLSTKIPFPYTEEDANWWITEGSKQGLARAISIEGQCVGCIGVMPGEFEYSRSGELGYWLDKAYWGKGLMQQAIVQITDETFKQTDIKRIFATVFHENIASQKLLDKSGYTLEAIHRQAIYKAENFYDAMIYVRLATD